MLHIIGDMRDPVYVLTRGFGWLRQAHVALPLGPSFLVAAPPLLAPLLDATHDESPPPP